MEGGVQGLMNEICLLIELLVIFSLLLVSYRLFKLNGLVVWISIASILANITVSKNITLFGMSATLGNVLFASNFLATDIISEVYGKDKAENAVNLGLFAVLVYLISTQFALMFIPNEIDFVHESMNNLFSIAPRICLSSVIMYYISNVLDVKLYNKLKDKGTKLWVRNNLCTIFCNCLENFGFVILAFYKIYDIKDILIMGISTSIIEIIIAIADTPFLYLAIKNEQNRLDN